MRPFLLPLSALSLLALVATPAALAGSATWDLDPMSGDWNTAENWIPATVPDGPADIATFSASNLTDVSLSAPTGVDSIVFSPDASAYQISVGSARRHRSLTLTISGAGLVNQSPVRQDFVTTDDNHGFGNKFRGLIQFTGSATAGDGNRFTNNGTGYGDFTATTKFFDSSNAGTSMFVNNASEKDFAFGGLTEFHDDSSAAGATLISNGAPGKTLETSGGETDFFDRSTADHAHLVAAGTALSSDGPGAVLFFDSSTAANSRIVVEGGGGTLGANGGAVAFLDDSTAGNAAITVASAAPGGNGGGGLSFQDSATAGNATVICSGTDSTDPHAPAAVAFTGAAQGGTASLQLGPRAMLSIGLHDAPGVSVGSISGAGTILLGLRNLTTGTDNRDTTFSGIIEDQNASGTLTKVGTGTLTLTGLNSYGGGTTVNGGALLSDGPDGSATGFGPVQVNAGTLGGGTTIAGAVTIGSGSGPGAFLAPVHKTLQEAVLSLRSTLDFRADGTYLCTYAANAAAPRSDRVKAKGITIESGATFELSAEGGEQLPADTLFTVLSNTSDAPIAGTFNNLPDGETITVAGTTFRADYEGGDGNDLTLRVVE